MSEITRILDRAQQGDVKAPEELLPLVYEELRKLAAHQMANEAAGHTLQPTALLHEAWLRLTDGQAQSWNGRGHFFAAAGEAMRRILIESARRKRSQRRGGDAERRPIEEADMILERPADEVLAVHDALDQLARNDPLAADFVKLRYFAGMTVAEAAEALRISARSADRIWAYARTWLRTEIDKDRLA